MGSEESRYRLSDLLDRHCQIDMGHIIKPAVITVIKAIRAFGGEARVVGGAVRDILLRRRITDVDLASSLTPEEGIKALTGIASSIIETSLEHGVITAIINGEKIEITTLRRDISCDGRRANVQYTDSWAEDAARRDFTINGLSLDLEGNVYDYFCGIDDLQKRIVRFIGNAEQRIHEDYLRLLRYIRFCAVFGSRNFEEQSFAAIVTLWQYVKTLSKSRIKSELWKFFSLKNAYKILYLFRQKGQMFEELFPGDVGSVYGRLRLIKNEPFLNFAAGLVLHHVKDASKVAARLDLTREERRILNHLLDAKLYDVESSCGALQLDSSIFEHQKRVNLLDGKCSYKIYKAHLMIRYILGEGKKRRMKIVLKHLLDFSPKFPLNGHDMIEIGVMGKDIAEKLMYARSLWVEKDFVMKREDLISAVLSCDKV